MILKRIAWLNAFKLLVSGFTLAALIAVFFQIWTLVGKGFDVSETFLNATASAPFSNFILPTFFVILGSVVGTSIGLQFSMAAVMTATAFAYLCLFHPFWVAALFSLPAAIVALSPLLSPHFALEKKNV